MHRWVVPTGWFPFQQRQKPRVGGGLPRFHTHKKFVTFVTTTRSKSTHTVYVYVLISASCSEWCLVRLVNLTSTCVRSFLFPSFSVFRSRLQQSYEVGDGRAGESIQKSDVYQHYLRECAPGSCVPPFAYALLSVVFPFSFFFFFPLGYVLFVAPLLCFQGCWMVTALCFRTEKEGGTASAVCQTQCVASGCAASERVFCVRR